MMDLDQHTDCPNKNEAGCYGPQPFDIDTSVFKESNRSLRGSIVYYTYEPQTTTCIVSDMINDVKAPLIKLLTQLVEYFKGFRLRMIIVFDLYEIGFDISRDNVYIPSKWATLSHKNFISSAVFQCVSYILEELNVYSERKSSWQVKACKSLHVHVGQLHRMQGRSYIKIPASLSHTQSLVNIKNKGHNCFSLCVMAALHSHEILKAFFIQREKKGLKIPDPGSALYCTLVKQKLSGPNQYEKLLRQNTTVDFSGLYESPSSGVSLIAIDHFEDLNPSISVTVYGHIEKQIMPIRNTRVVRDFHINLLLISDGENFHYIWIKDLSKALGESGKKSHIYCCMCNKQYKNEDALNKHILRCGAGLNSKQQCKPPSETFCRFKQWEMTLRNPYVVYFLFHFYKPSPDATPIAESYCLCLIGPRGYKYLEFYEGSDAVAHFLRRSFELATEVVNLISTTNVPAIWTDSQLQAFEAATVCDFCRQIFSPIDKKTLHHSHTFGTIGGDVGMCTDFEYTGALHNSCNLQARIPPFLNCITVAGNDIFNSILFHGYHDRLIFKSFPLTHKNGKIIGLKLNNILRINVLDNFKEEPLHYLTKQTHEAGGVFSHLNHFAFRNKSIIPDVLKYDFIFPTKFKLTDLKDIAQAAKYSTFLNKKLFDSVSDVCSDEQYRMYRLIKREFKLEGPQQYMEYFLKLKCLSLAGVFQHYRDKHFNNSGLDPIFAWTYGSFAFSCCLLKNRIELEYMKDQSHIEMTDKMIKAGVSVITTHLKASNSTRSESFNPRKKRSEILEIDRSLSYGSALSQALPIGSFESLTESELRDFNYYCPETNTGYGYVFECSLTLPAEYHELYRDLPLWSEKREVIVNDQYDVKCKYKSTYWKNSGRETKRNLLTLYDKIDDCFYYKSLSFMLNHHYKLLNVKRGFKFREEPFLKPYIDYRVEKRNSATSELDRNEEKSFINIIFGKFLSKGINYPSHEFVFTKVRATQLFSRDLFENVEIISDNLSLFQFRKGSGTDYNLRIIGAIVLELGKLALYECYYNKIVPTFPNCKLLLSNTDSLLVSVPDPENNYIEKLKGIVDTFDFSNLPTDHPLFSTENKGKPGYWKMVHTDIIEFVGLRVTNYSLKFGRDKVSYKCAGVNKGLLNNAQRHEAIRNSVYNFTKRKIPIESITIGPDGTLNINVHETAVTSVDMTRIWYGPLYSVPFGYKGPLPFDDLVKYSM